MSQSPLPPDFDPETIAEDQITEIYNSFNPFRPLEPGMVKTKNNPNLNPNRSPISHLLSPIFCDAVPYTSSIPNPFR